MFTALTTLFTTTNWGFVIAMTVISTVLGALWYGKYIFGGVYMKRIGFENMKKKMEPNMTVPLTLEIISRILFFVGLGMAIATGGMGMALVVWLCFVFATSLSQTAWAGVDNRVVLLIAGKVLLDTIIAVYVYGAIVS